MRSLISIDFLAPKWAWNLKAHMWYQLSPFTSSNVLPAMQHDPDNIHQSFSRYVLIQSPTKLDTMSNNDGERKPSMLHLFTSFHNQILAPSRFKSINF